MAVAGVDIRELVCGASETERLLKMLPAQENPALRYAALRTLYHRNGYKAEMLSAFEPRLAWFFNGGNSFSLRVRGRTEKAFCPSPENTPSSCTASGTSCRKGHI